jgi:hypothetical protein
MDSLQSARGAGLHVHADRHCAMPARLIGPALRWTAARNYTPRRGVRFCVRLNLFSFLGPFFCNSKRLSPRRE